VGGDNGEAVRAAYYRSWKVLKGVDTDAFVKAVQFAHC
jgi:hypothetical protein